MKASRNVQILVAHSLKRKSPPITPTKGAHKVTRLRSVANNNTTGVWKDSEEGPLLCLPKQHLNAHVLQTKRGYGIQAHAHCCGIFHFMGEVLPSPGNVLES